jgi:hypothetical protein
LVIACIVLLAVIVAAMARQPRRPAQRSPEYQQAWKDFHGQREPLEAKFVELAALSGMPRGLRWTDCQFEDGVVYARDRRSGQLRAFVAVTVTLEAIEAGLMEGSEAVGHLREATAVFHFDGERWQTDGRAIFNLDPTETVAHFHNHLVLVGQESAHRT